MNRGSTIALNRKAKRNYHLGERLEAGLVLEGWELKSLRAGRAQIADTYVLLRQGGQAWLLGSVITPLPDAQLQPPPDPGRTCKLLLHRRELQKLTGALQRKGFSCVCTALYWKRHLVKCELALAKGKKLYDKRADEKKRDQERELHRALSRRSRS